MSSSKELGGRPHEVLPIAASEGVCRRMAEWACRAVHECGGGGAGRDGHADSKVAQIGIDRDWLGAKAHVARVIGNKASWIKIRVQATVAMKSCRAWLVLLL